MSEPLPPSSEPVSSPAAPPVLDPAAPPATALPAAAAKSAADTRVDEALADPGVGWPLEIKALLWLVLATSALFALILWPFSGALAWAVFLAISFWPVHLKIVDGLRGRRGWAAFVTLCIIVLIVLLPLAFVVGSVVQESAMLGQRIQKGEIPIGTYFQQLVDLLPSWTRGLLHRFGFGDLAHVQQKIMTALSTSGQTLGLQVFVIGQNTLDFLVSLCLMLYVLFFMLRDGRGLTGMIERAIPLRRSDTRRLMMQFAIVVRATVKGNIVVALVQGALGGLAFWFLGVPGALMWGSIMALLSLLPAVGAALVWLPVAGWFFATGQVWQAVALVVWGSVVIGIVDNLLRPLLVGKDTRMPDYLVLVATLGGIAVFGLNGFVIGPVIAALFLVSWELLATLRPMLTPRRAPARNRTNNP